MILRFTLILSLVFVSASSFAGDLQAAFAALQNSKVNYEPDGAVCEQLAILKARVTYPESAYDITGGIEYDIGGETLGELDLVILEKQTRKVVLVEEVKCWKNYGSGLDKAKVQRDRFMWNLTKFTSKIRFTSYTDEQFTAENFQNAFPFIFVSHAGGVKHGFDQELDFNMSEVRELRTQLLKCQAFGPCPKPE
ncbi:hypothetical protein [Bdellovibrio svalbardensis]|uniref:NERD domain-containing protein n=1 Tax=Bdellovibrio svalbardensis TaxID=2972972 RepID=A0ABT6DQM5_9BACT|nr:hypothetical protein [Bdellovibrio svalbardensis]MDG0817458.1 hypothetical protein [Bdellovibrio svalbardensis]